MHPLKFVTQCNVIDQLSHGKLLVGIGAGNSPDEFNGYGLPVEERHEMLQEFLAVADQAWAAPEGGFSYGGKYYNGTVKGRIIPSPYQRPRPHIVYATATPETLERIGKRGWSLLVGPQPPEVIGKRLHFYLNGLESSGLDQAVREKAWKYSGFLKQVYVAAPGEDWRETLRPYMETYTRKSALANSGIDDLPKDDLEERITRYAASWLIAGSHDEVIERLRPFAQLGFGHMMCWFTFGHMPDEMVRASMLRFTALVAPVLREVQPDPELQERIIAASAAPMKQTFLEPSVT
jgi:alkanesulfonate monooxygenase SsuD/methylene tetrahydromethanopterin reductase-like flavin-dependent oxidoreductase (luciferase family)